MIFTATMLIMASASPEIDCTKASSTPDLRYCAALELEAADEAMTKQWNEISAHMKQEDARYDKQVHIREDNGPGYHQTLLAGQRAWITYREQACQLSGYMFRGGTMDRKSGEMR